MESIQEDEEAEGRPSNAQSNRVSVANKFVASPREIKSTILDNVNVIVEEVENVEEDEVVTLPEEDL